MRRMTVLKCLSAKSKQVCEGAVNIGESFGTTDIEWNPTGRYIATSSTDGADIERRFPAGSGALVLQFRALSKVERVWFTLRRCLSLARYIPPSSRPAVESGLGPAPKHGEAARMRKSVLLVGQGMLAKEERLLKELADCAQIPVTTTLQGLARILFKKKSQMARLLGRVVRSNLLKRTKELLQGPQFQCCEILVLRRRCLWGNLCVGETDC